MMNRRRRPELEMVMSAAAIGVQHVRVGISRLIRRWITLLIHRLRRRRWHYSLELVLLLLRLVVIVAVGQIEAGTEIGGH